MWGNCGGNIYSGKIFRKRMMNDAKLKFVYVNQNEV